jgi:HPt (histidine-containing phosphotransfer) domain-containing protein
VDELPVLDPQSLHDLLDLGADAGLVQELIALFCEDVPPRMEALRTALAVGDTARILVESHQLKGALGNLGLARFAKQAARIEAEARAGQLVETPALVEGLPAAYEEALRALNQAFPA